MSFLLYFIGLVFGVAVFIYIYSTYQSGKEKIKGLREMSITPAEPTVKPENIAFINMKRPPGSRLCPLCGKTLTEYEALYASEVDDEKGKKILIHGCRYCYKPDDES